MRKFVLFFTALLFPVFGMAAEMPASYPLSLFVDRLSLMPERISAGGELEGKFIARNGSPFAVREIRYGLYLAPKNRVVRPDYLPANAPLALLSSYIYTVAGYQYGESSFDLAEGASREISFSYQLPQFFPGEYWAWVTLYPSRGSAFSSKEISLRVDGTARPLIRISDAAFVTKESDGKTYTDVAGFASYAAGEAVTLSYEVTNTIDAPIVILPHVVLRNRHFASDVAVEFDGAEFRAAKGVSRMTVAFPSTLRPGLYAVAVSFTAPKKAGARGGAVLFPVVSKLNFVVQGEYGDILNVVPRTTDGRHELEVWARGPFEPDRELGEVVAVARVIDLVTGQEAASDRVAFPLTGLRGEHYTEKRMLAFGREAPAYPRYDVTLTKGGVVLDRMTVEPNEKPPIGVIVSPPDQPRTDFSSYAALAAVFLVALALGAWWMRKKNSDSALPPSLPLVLLFFLVAGGYGASAHAAVGVDYAPSYAGMPQSPQFITPTDGATILVGGNFSLDVRSNTPNLGSPHGCDDHPGLQSGTVFLILSDKSANNPADPSLANITSANIAAYFPDSNYARGNLSYWGYVSYTAGCVSYLEQNISGTFTVPERGSKNESMMGRQYLYVVSLGAAKFVVHEEVNVTGVAYELNTIPDTRTVTVGQSAEYDTRVIPNQVSSFVPNAPAEIDYTKPFSGGYSPTVFVYWDQPQYESEYAPGGTVTFSLGSYSESNRVGTNDCSRLTWAGTARATIVLTDGTASGNLQNLNSQNVNGHFASTNYAVMGQIPSSLILGYNRDCTLWFRGSTAGFLQLPATGSRGAFNEYVNVYAIYEADAGSFIAHQRIRITQNPAVGRPIRTSSFAEPVNFRLVQMTLPNEFYDAVLQPATAQSVGGAYAPAKLRITIKERQRTEQLPCPEGMIDFGIGCYNIFTESIDPYPTRVINEPPPAGAYSFRIQGTSAGNIPGIVRDSGPLTLVITAPATPPPPPFDDLGPNPGGPGGPGNAAGCIGGRSVVSLRWTDTSGEDGYRVIRIHGSERTVIQLTRDTMTFQDEDPSLRSGEFYTYIVEAFNQSGTAQTNAFTVRVADCRGGGPEPRPQCSDNADNDGDGEIDFPNDPGCNNPQDDDERDVPRPQCSDTVDNDGDGKIDFSSDPGCSDVNDDDERDGNPPPQCSDGIDNDGDGKIDFGRDPGCSSREDNNERDVGVPIPCEIDPATKQCRR